MCSILQGHALGQTPPGENVEQILLSQCMSILLVAEFSFVANAAGKVASGEVTIPLTDALLKGLLGRAGTAALFGSQLPETLVGSAIGAVLLGVLDIAACQYLVKCVVDSFFDNTAEAICTSSANPNPPGSSTTTSAPSPTGTAYSGYKQTITGSLLPVPTINLDSTAAKCQLCQLNSYFAGTQINYQYCSNDSYVPTKDVLGYFCDPTVANDTDFSQLCTQSCQHPCDQFDVNAWMKQLGTFMPVRQ